MKNIFFILLSAGTIAVKAQKGDQHMEAVTVPGYYLGQKGDTVRGEIQSNPEAATDIYLGVNFKPKGGGKLTKIDVKKAKGYGFEGRHFTAIASDAESGMYAERLVNGRLKFYEFKKPGMKDGKSVIVSDYYIQDSQSDEKEMGLRELKQINLNFYKKDLKPYMKAQLVTWNDLDKFNFVKDKVVNALKEFNKFYDAPPEAKEEGNKDE